ncbi:MAG: hypothetical protein RL250_1126, partial [Verrucomicrobiota bacterium]
ALLRASTVGRPGPRVYNVGDGRPITKQELAVWLAQRLRLGAPVFDASAPAGPRMAKGGRTQPNRVVSVERIRRELAWEPAFADIRAGLTPLL